MNRSFREELKKQGKGRRAARRKFETLVPCDYSEEVHGLHPVRVVIDNTDQILQIQTGCELVVGAVVNTLGGTSCGGAAQRMFDTLSESMTSYRLEDRKKTLQQDLKYIAGIVHSAHHNRCERRRDTKTSFVHKLFTKHLRKVLKPLSRHMRVEVGMNKYRQLTLSLGHGSPVGIRKEQRWELDEARVLQLATNTNTYNTFSYNSSGPGECHVCEREYAHVKKHAETKKHARNFLALIRKVNEPIKKREEKKEEVTT